MKKTELKNKCKSFKSNYKDQTPYPKACFLFSTIKPNEYQKVKVCCRRGSSILRKDYPGFSNDFQVGDFSHYKDKITTTRLKDIGIAVIVNWVEKVIYWLIIDKDDEDERSRYLCCSYEEICDRHRCRFPRTPSEVLEYIGTKLGEYENNIYIY